ncbi:phosphatase PAP2 family protein [Mucilaginibacter sp. RS28]|uniref:Phosphatase PAP2 family protein n=1 Tax=Mucilaginibacter straminoryzae TaxID=2932774 RepID=A0A9X1X7H1_9SPHI|nr:phosphatase PAP2 family protein [Mucilaginibacter straminoryzae]MCJ8211850.1 phosphatase PAP2 family protein [Mucilaginibacter straminoryzae]
MSAKFNIIIFSLITGIVYCSCKKDIKERTNEYPALTPKNIDVNADTWKPVLLTGFSDLTVATPDAVNSPAYLADLNEIKALQSNITAEQKAIVNYWSAGSVLRWNEILRELVAKHNIPPYQNEDGTYPAPSSANPFAYPQFPFSNPPYAARSYAYISAAQYDALIAAWKFKKTYNRAAPYKNDANIQALIPKSDLPAYPSEDGVVAGTVVELMKLLFPTEIAFIEQKASEEKLYRMISGANTRSDWDAGVSLGKQVAAKFTTRARADRAGAAIGTPTIWAQLESQTAATGEMPWISLENPKRPPMLPLFGKVEPFLFDQATVATLRPGPPPSTKSDQFKKEADEVLYYCKNVTRERNAQVAFWADGAGTYTPAGHWDAIAADEFVKENWSEVRWARNMALLNMAMMDAVIVCWDTKYYYFNPRPSQFDTEIKTLTGIPNFPSYTSGHSNFSAAAATVLTHLLPERGTKFSDLAQSAAMSRLYGGIHYRTDCEVGLVTGAKVGQYAVNRAKTDGAE